MKITRLLSLLLIACMILSISAVTASASPYSDVAETRWSYGDIIYASEKGYMTGIGGGKFSPAGTMQRAMIVTVLYRMEGSPSVTFTSRFKDVPAGKYYSNAVIWAADNKIVTGTSANTFDPSGAVTREQMATFFYRYATLKNVDTTEKNNIKGYSDYSKISSYAVDAFAWANKVGLISGTTKTTLDPKGKATREQFSAILHRYDTTELTYLKVFTNPVMKSSYTEKEYPLVDNADFYVSVKGNDNNDGSFEHPFATFERAKAAVNELKAKKTGEIVVAFMAGSYGRLNIDFNSADSGTAETPIVYCKYGDGDVNFVNGATISEEEFVPIDSSDYHLFNSASYGNIYKVDLSEKININDISDSTRLFAEGSVCYSARYPNKNDDGTDSFLSVYQKLGDRSVKLMAFIGKKFTGYSRINEIKVNGYFNYEWGSESGLPVASYDASTYALTFATDTFWGIGNNGGQFYYYNVPEELDHADEYYIDAETGTLYVYQPSGNYNLALYGAFFSLNSDSQYITLRGFNFIGSTKRGGLLTGYKNSLENCTITGAVDGLLRVDGYCNTVDSCELSQSEDCGIWCGGGVESSFTHSDILITNCSIHDFGLVKRSYAPAFGIADNGGCGITFSHNEIYNCPHVAVQYGGVDCTFEYNVIHDACLGAEDMGAFYAGKSFVNRGTVIRYNVFYNIGSGSGCTAIYLDDGLAGQTIYGNMFFKSNGWGCVSVGGGRENYICDNIMINTGESETAGVNCFAKYYDAALTGSMESTGSFTGLLQNYQEHEALVTTSSLWTTKYPHLAALNTDPFQITDPDCIACPSYCTIKNNLCIGNIHSSIDEAYSTFGEVENNTTISKDECDMFADPTHGDYTIKNGTFTIDIPFEEIGRY